MGSKLAIVQNQVVLTQVISTNKFGVIKMYFFKCQWKPLLLYCNILPPEHASISPCTGLLQVRESYAWAWMSGNIDNITDHSTVCWKTREQFSFSFFIINAIRTRFYSISIMEKSWLNFPYDFPQQARINHTAVNSVTPAYLLSKNLITSHAPECTGAYL